jgi:hypothetical protein
VSTERKRENEDQGERGRKGFVASLGGVSRGSFSASTRQARGGARGWPGMATQVLSVLNEEDKVLFAKSTLALGSFPGKLKTALVCNVW